MTYMSSGYQQPTPPASMTLELSPRQRMLLTIVVDLMLDPAHNNSLLKVLTAKNLDAMDMIRLLAHQWNKGLSTLSGDLAQPHDLYLKPTTASHFITGMQHALETDTGLHNLGQDSQKTYSEMLRYMAKNQPFHAAWCAAQLWVSPHVRAATLN